MEDQKSSNQSILCDDLILNWLPNSEEMLKKTLNNKNTIYYPTPCSSDFFKVFDIASQKGNVDADDEFISIDQKNASSVGKAKSKTQPVKKTTSTTTKKAPQNVKSAGTASGLNKLKNPQTIQIQADWKVVADFNKQSLEKLRLEGEPEVEDKLWCGDLYKISEEYEKDIINPLNPVSLKRFDDFKFFGNISTLDDDKMKSGTEIANVFVTDKILSVIMTSTLNSKPWHLKITKIGESVFIDKMQNSEIDFTTVNESSEVLPPEDDDKNIDSFKNLAIEATLINEFIKEQIIDSSIKYEEELEVPVESHPFNEERASDIERLVYRYRVWKVGDFDVLVRSQVHAFDENEKGENIFVNIYALNEFDVNKIFDNLEK
jgi:hypothetical protein